MENKQKISTKRLVLTARLAALVVVGCALRITIPIDIGGNTAFHLGNIMCALSGILLGPWLGGLAAGLGSMIYDMFNPIYISECWITFLSKGAYGVVTGLVILGFKKEWNHGIAALATTAGAVTYGVLYLLKPYLKSVLVKGYAAEAAWLAVVAKLPATVFNAVVAVIFAPILAVVIRKALRESHMDLT